MERINRILYTERIINLLGKEEVIVLTGHRRAGKSCILEYLRKQLAERGNVLYLDKEDPDNADIQSYEHLNDWIKGHISENVSN